jgi:hypothetical protein
LIAQIVVDENSNPHFDLFIQLADTPLIQQNLDKAITGAGTYQLEIGKFSYNTNAEIVDVIRTAELITGSGQNGYDYINIGEVKTTMVQSGINAEVDIENVVDEETGEKKTNFNFSIPETAGTSININGEQKTTVDFSSEPQKQIDEKISYKEQTLTLEQQEQTRKNISASRKVLNPTPNDLAGIDADGDLFDTGINKENVLTTNTEQTITAEKILANDVSISSTNGKLFVTDGVNFSVGNAGQYLNFSGMSDRPVYWRENAYKAIAFTNDINNISMKPSNTFLFKKITEFTTANATVFTAPANGYVTIRGEFNSRTAYYLKTASGVASFYQYVTSNSSPFFAVKSGDEIHLAGEEAQIIWADLYFSQADEI